MRSTVCATENGLQVVTIDDQEYLPDVEGSKERPIEDSIEHGKCLQTTLDREGRV